MFVEDRLEGIIDTRLPVLKEPSAPIIYIVNGSAYSEGTIDVEDQDFVVSQF